MVPRFGLGKFLDTGTELRSDLRDVKLIFLIRKRVLKYLKFLSPAARLLFLLSSFSNVTRTMWGSCS